MRSQNGFYLGESQGSASTFFLLTAPREVLSSLCWWRLLFLPSVPVSEAPPDATGAPNCLLRTPQVSLIACFCSGSITSSSPSSLLCLSTSRFLLIPKCPYSYFPCSPKRHDHMVVAEGVPPGNGEIELDIRLHPSDIHHSGPFTGGLLLCLPGPSQNSGCPNPCSALPATSQTDALATLASLTPLRCYSPPQNSDHFHPNSLPDWALVLKPPNQKALKYSSPPNAHPPHSAKEKLYWG